jgi:hypothetical protein
MLCAFAFTALTAQGAGAATKGTTLFTCKKVTPSLTTKGFSKAHCKTEDAINQNAEYEHFEVPQNTTTEITGTNETTGGTLEPALLKSTISGINVELESAVVHIKEGSVLTNLLVGSQHYISGRIILQYTNVKVKAPAGKGCAVKGEAVTTNELSVTTENQEMETKFEPTTGETFAEFEVEGCTGSEALKALNGLYKVTGSVKCTPDGATVTCTHAGTTAQGTLKLRGQKAGINSTQTVLGTDKPAGDKTDTPLSVTTVETP